MPKQPTDPGTQRVRDYRKKMTKLGLVRLSCYVPKQNRDAIVAECNRLTEAHKKRQESKT